MQFVHRPLVVEAHQWFTNGDHPLDRCKTLMINGKPVLDDGKIVRRFYGMYAEHIGQCMKCERAYNDHGKVNTGTNDVTVCPGDWIVPTLDGFYEPIKPEMFEKLYAPYVAG
jgi:hypothetical protein